MDYYHIPKHCANRYAGELLTAREMAADSNKQQLLTVAERVEWPKNYTIKTPSGRYRTASKCLVLSPNGDPFGSGFTAIERIFPSDNGGFIRGDYGAKSLTEWRAIAFRENMALVRK